MFSSLRGNSYHDTAHFMWDFEGVRQFLYCGDPTSNLDQTEVEKLESEFKKMRFLLRSKTGEFFFVLKQFRQYLKKVNNSPDVTTFFFGRKYNFPWFFFLTKS